MCFHCSLSSFLLQPVHIRRSPLKSLSSGGADGCAQQPRPQGPLRERRALGTRLCAQAISLKHRFATTDVVFELFCPKMSSASSGDPLCKVADFEQGEDERIVNVFPR